MAEYIHRDMAIACLTKVEVTEKIPTMAHAKRAIADMPAADVVPVVRCKDCEHAYKCFGRLRCDHGVCMGSIVREDFFCADGVKREVADD